MGFMDKAKEAAEKAKTSAQQVAHQGQAKVGEFQFDRATADLYKTLGEAYYAEQRQGGSHDAVAAALDAVAAHLASRPEAENPAGSTPPPPPPPGA